MLVSPAKSWDSSLVEGYDQAFCSLLDVYVFYMGLLFAEECVVYCDMTAVSRKSLGRKVIHYLTTADKRVSTAAKTRFGISNTRAISRQQSACHLILGYGVFYESVPRLPEPSGSKILS
jgi:hypothetical protein